MTNIDVVSSRTASSFAQRFPDRGALRQRSVLSGRSFREISVPRFILAATKYFASFEICQLFARWRYTQWKLIFQWFARKKERERKKEKTSWMKRFCAESQETCTCARGKRVVVIIIGRKTQRVPSRDSSGNYPVIKATDYRSEFCGAWTGNCDTAYPTE